MHPPPLFCSKCYQTANLGWLHAVVISAEKQRLAAGGSAGWDAEEGLKLSRWHRQALCQPRGTTWWAYGSACCIRYRAGNKRHLCFILLSLPPLCDFTFSHQTTAVLFSGVWKIQQQKEPRKKKRREEKEEKKKRKRRNLLFFCNNWSAETRNLSASCDC